MKSPVLWVGLAVMTVSLAIIFGTVALTHRLDQLTIQRERICSESNQQACVSLFDRLARNITPEQRLELACSVAVVLKLDVPPRCPD